MTERCTTIELQGRLATLESDLRGIHSLMDERDKRYSERSVAQDTAVAAALSTSKEAVTKAEVATEKRLEVLNELRGVVVDQSREFARKPELELIVAGIETRLAALNSQVTAAREHGGGVKDTLGFVVGFIGLAIAGLAVYLHH